MPPIAEREALDGDVGAGSEATRSFVRGGTLAIIGFGAAAALQFLFAVITARVLAPAVAGAFFETFALVTILSRWADLGASTGFERFIPLLRARKADGELRALVVGAVVPVAVVGVLVAAAGYATSGTLEHQLYGEAHQSQGSHLLDLILPAIPLVAVSTALLSATRGWGSMVPYVSIQNIGVPAARVALLLAVCVAGASAAAIGAAWVLPLVPGLAAVVLVVRARMASLSASTVSSRTPVVTLKDFWLFSAPRGLAAGFLITVSWLDVLLLGVLSDSRDAAIYTAASNIAVVGTYALQAVGLAIAPQFSTLLARDARTGLRRLYEAATSWMMLLAWPFYILVLAFAPTFLGLFGPDYVEGATALRILAVAGMASLATGHSSILLLMGGHSGWGLLNAGAALVINVALNISLIPSHGLLGAAIAWAAAIVVNNAASLIQVALLLGLKPFGSGYGIAAGGSLAIFGLASIAAISVAGQTPAALIASVVLASAIYAGFVSWKRDRLALPLLAESVRRGTAGAGRASGSPKT